MRAVAIVLQAKVFVDLEQTLLLRHGAKKLSPARVIAEKPRRARLDASIRQASWTPGVLRPNVAPGQLPERDDDVGLDFVQASLADESQWRRARARR